MFYYKDKLTGTGNRSFVYSFDIDTFSFNILILHNLSTFLFCLALYSLIVLAISCILFCICIWFFLVFCRPTHSTNDC